MDTRTPRDRQATEQTGDGGSVRIGPVLLLRDVVLELGVDFAELLAEVGLDPKVLDDPDQTIPMVVQHRLVALAVKRTGCDHIGLLVGQRGGLNVIGIAGLLVRYSPDVLTAIRSVVRYRRTHVRGANIELTVTGDVSSLSWRSDLPELAAPDQTGDAAVGVMFNMLRELCGPDWKPIEVCFAHREPTRADPFKRFFRTTLRFGAEEYAIHFATAWLHRPVAQGDPTLERLLLKELEAAEERLDGDLPQQVRSALRSALLSGRARSDKLAALLSMHGPTLARDLKAYGIGLRELVDECRFEVAREMLEQSTVDIGHIAAMLDYADASAFTRAFRRWSGTTPTGWRTQRQRQA